VQDIDRWAGEKSRCFHSSGQNLRPAGGRRSGEPNHAVPQNPVHADSRKLKPPHASGNKQQKFARLFARSPARNRKAFSKRAARVQRTTGGRFVTTATLKGIDLQDSSYNYWSYISRKPPAAPYIPSANGNGKAPHLSARARKNISPCRSSGICISYSQEHGTA